MTRLEYVPFAPLHTHLCGVCRRHWFCEATVNAADCGLSTCEHCRLVLRIARALMLTFGCDVREALDLALDSVAWAEVRS
jgi:hypothetical protein